jgi:hypothetical protein
VNIRDLRRGSRAAAKLSPRRASDFQDRPWARAADVSPHYSGTYGNSAEAQKLNIDCSRLCNGHYATDIAQFMRAGDMRKEFFAASFPVTTTVQIGRLYHPELMVEIAAIAEIPRDRFHRPAA